MKYFFFSIVAINALAQSACAQDQLPPSYPKLTGYFSVVNPLVNWSSAGTSTNFSSGYTIGFPTGLNIVKNDKIAFSFELTPFIKSENGTTKSSNLLFHPGIIYSLTSCNRISCRAAFESSGRYGFTIVLGRVIVKKNSCSYFVAVPFPVRFGNDLPSSIGISAQIGISF